MHGLRQALGSAWKAKAAGFESGTVLKVQGNLIFIQTNEHFARLLTSCGIKASRSDIENDKRRPFQRGVVPYTERAKEAFEKVKEVYPGLREEEIFAYLNADSLLSIDKDVVCPFIERLKR